MFALCLSVLLCFWAVITASRMLGSRIKIEAIKQLASDLRSSYHNPFQCFDQYDDLQYEINVIFLGYELFRDYLLHRPEFISPDQT